MQERHHRTADRSLPERCVRHQVAVVLAHPVDKPIAAGIAYQDIPAGAAVSPILVVGMGIRHIIEITVGIVIVVRIEQVVAPAAVDVIATGAAHQPVVAQVSKDGVLAVVIDIRIGRGLLTRSLRHFTFRPKHAFTLGEV